MQHWHGSSARPPRPRLTHAGRAVRRTCRRGSVSHMERLALLFVLLCAALDGSNAARKSRVAKAATECSDQLAPQQGMNCKMYARSGGCMDTPGWSADNCAKSCKLCPLADSKTRCHHKNWKKMKMSMKNAWDVEGEKSLDAMFRGLEAKFPQYKTKVLNMPLQDNQVSTWEQPWLVHFEDFVKEEESKVLLKYTKDEFDRADDDKENNRFGTYRPGDRTNKNAWCTRDNGCAADRKVKALQKRISEVVGAPMNNFENLQILNYGPGERYQTHHDHEGEDTVEAFSGPRVLTFFMYFNDVEEGGETQFPWVNGTELHRHPGAEKFLADISDRGLHYASGLAIKPRKGSAVLWASVGDDLHQQLHETHHAALPVIKGNKFAANAWIHLRDLETPSKWNCQGKPEYPQNDPNPGDPPGLFYDQAVPAWIEEGMQPKPKQEL